MKKFKKLIAFSVLLVLTLGLATGCSGDDTTDDKSTGEKSSEDSTDEASKGDIELVFAQDLNVDEKANEVINDIIAQYQEDSGVTIRLESLPPGDYRTWLTTQFSAGEGPDVYSGILYDMASDYNSGWLYNFNDLFEEESAYDQGKAWKETLPDYILQRMYISEDNVPGYPTATAVVRIFVNKTMLEEAGAKIPETWEEFIDASEKIKENGKIPFAFPNASIGDLSWLWFNNSITSQLNSDLVAEIDVTGNGYVELNEIVKAWDEGKLDFTEDSFVEGYELMKEFSQYWTSDYNGLDQQSSREMFVRGDVAMVQAMSTDLRTIDEVLPEGFEYVVIPVPTVTKGTSEHAMEKSVVLGGQPDIIYSINANLEEDQTKLDAAIDFVQYMSSPEVQATLAEELYRIPLSTSTELPEHLQGFIINEEPLRIAYYTGINEKLRNYFHRAGQQFLEGGIDVNEFTETVNESYGEVLEEIKLENDWTAENNYKISDN